MTPLVVAIDGPSGTGKSTISRRLASELGLAYLDTGAMYRVATWWCLHLGLDLTDHEAVAEAVRTIPMEIGTDPAHPTFAVDGQDVSGEIRSTRISAAVSAVATNLGVRPELQRRQREAIAAELRPGSFSQGRGVIAEGRDITTVVAPEAPVRILLLADAHARLERRARELHGTADAEAIAATRDQVERRDADDSTVSNFTTAADGVVTVDTSTLTLDEAVATVRAVITAADESPRTQEQQ
ncbi:MAG TPA: (d)CMP kinase [Ruania sp.]|nr:(d)CMP kinase [Ruania sp.]